MHQCNWTSNIIVYRKRATEIYYKMHGDSENRLVYRAIRKVNAAFHGVTDI